MPDRDGFGPARFRRGRYEGSRRGTLGFWDVFAAVLLALCVFSVVQGVTRVVRGVEGARPHAARDRHVRRVDGKERITPGTTAALAASAPSTRATPARLSRPDHGKSQCCAVRLCRRTHRTEARRWLGRHWRAMPGDLAVTASCTLIAAPARD